MNLDLEQLVQDVHDGNEDPLKAWAILNDMTTLLKKCQNEVKNYALQEAENRSEKTFNEYGYTFTFKNGGRMWDFKHIEEWQEADVKKKAIENKLKAAFEQKERGVMSVAEDGEVLELPKVSYRGDSLSVKVAK